MKKLITLLLVLVTLEGYSQEDSIYHYYKEITKDLWVWDNNTNDWVPDTTQQWKWNKDVHIYLYGEKIDFLIKELEIVVKELNDLIVPINIYITNDSSTANCKLFIGNGKEYKHHNLQYHNLIENGGTKPYGYASILGNLKEICISLCFVDILYLKEQGINNNWSNSRLEKEMRCTLREEITQSLGFVNDSYSYPMSIFQESKYIPITEFADIDKEIIKRLYN